MPIHLYNVYNCFGGNESLLSCYFQVLFFVFWPFFLSSLLLLVCECCYVWLWPTNHWGFLFIFRHYFYCMLSGWVISIDLYSSWLIFLPIQFLNPLGTYSLQLLYFQFQNFSLLFQYMYNFCLFIDILYLMRHCSHTFLLFFWCGFL